MKKTNKHILDLNEFKQSERERERKIGWKICEHSKVMREKKCRHNNMCSPNDTQAHAAGCRSNIHATTCCIWMLFLFLLLLLLFQFAWQFFVRLYVCFCPNPLLFQLWHTAKKNSITKKSGEEKNRRYYLGMHWSRLKAGCMQNRFGLPDSLALSSFQCVRTDRSEKRQANKRIQRIKRTFIEKKRVGFFSAFAFYLSLG